MTSRDLASSTRRVTVSQGPTLYLEGSWWFPVNSQSVCLPASLPPFLLFFPPPLPSSLQYSAVLFHSGEECASKAKVGDSLDRAATTSSKTKMQNSQTAKAQAHMLLVYCWIPSTLHGACHMVGIQGIFFECQVRVSTPPPTHTQSWSHRELCILLKVLKKMIDL